MEIRRISEKWLMSQEVDMDHKIRGCIQKFPDWSPGARTANGIALQLHSYFVSQSSEFCLHNPLYCSPTSVYCCCLFCYRLSSETFGYILVYTSLRSTTFVEIYLFSM
jgi:hypothetical protein